MTFDQIAQGVYRRTGKDTASPPSLTAVRVKAYINQAHRHLLSKPGMGRFKYGLQPFSSVADQSRYALVNVAGVRGITDTTNDCPLSPLSVSEYRRVNPDPTASSGTPQHYVFFGYEPVAKQPADASALYVKSTSASDTTQVLYLGGDYTGGYNLEASVTLTGTTAVLVSTAVGTFERIRKCYLSAVCVGTVTLHEDSSVGTELARIAIGHTQTRYWIGELTPRPAAINTYVADIELATVDMVNATDTPRIPEDFHDLIELRATMDELTKTDDGRYVVVEKEYRERMKDLRYWLGTQTDGDAPPCEHSSLGPWFPAGS